MMKRKQVVLIEGAVNATSGRVTKRIDFDFVPKQVKVRQIYVAATGNAIFGVKCPQISSNYLGIIGCDANVWNELLPGNTITLTNQIYSGNYTFNTVDLNGGESGPTTDCSLLVMILEFST